MEPEATQYEGAEVQQESDNSGSDDAALLSAFLAQEDHSSDGIDAASSDIPAGQEVEPVQSVDNFTVKINGEEKQVSRDELIAHYQKGEASNQKFEEAANLRREVEQQKAATTQQQAQLQNAINHFMQTANQWAQEGQPDWANLLENNPHEYLRQKELFAARQAEFSKAQAAQAYLNEQNQAQQQQSMAAHLETEGAKMLEIIPEWKNQDVRQAEEQELIKYLTGKGYTRDELQNLNQSKASNIALVLNSMRYEKLVAQSKAATKQLQNLPPRVERPGVASQGNNNRSEAMQRLARSGSIDDATSAFAALFG
jgi:hypothetical protein